MLSCTDPCMCMCPASVRVIGCACVRLMCTVPHRAAAAPRRVRRELACQRSTRTPSTTARCACACACTSHACGHLARLSPLAACSPAASPVSTQRGICTSRSAHARSPFPTPDTTFACAILTSRRCPLSRPSAHRATWRASEAVGARNGRISGCGLFWRGPVIAPDPLHA